VANTLGPTVARGSRSTVYAWGDDAVVKVPFDDTPDEWIVFEARYAAAVYAIGAPVPRVLGVEQIDGRAASVFERVHGPSMWEHVINQPEQASAVGRQLAELQAGLFSLLAPLALPSQSDRLSGKIRRAARHVDRSIAKALALLPPPRRPPRLCHGDLHPNNVLMSSEGPRIIDWFDAARGDPAADIARTSLLLGVVRPHALLPHHLPGARADLLGEVHGSYWERINTLAPIAASEAARWSLVTVAARLAEGMEDETLLAIWRARRGVTALEKGA
jgi:aminoglycoside phosphotransferase (APT) family kinase protein